MRNYVAQRRARALRNQLTDTEQHLWRQLRRRQLSGYRFRRQVPIGAYIVDFVCLEAKLVIELDGGQHMDRRDYDEHRDRALEKRGFQILRFWDNEVLRDTTVVMEAILDALKKACPLPNLPPHAGEGDSQQSRGRR
ncbi:MAG: endonuclease domain-containing protein [Betaproteobacteria bacterium]|nr:endonuclease domain-containing protein [Betaproteobacteria bacterium]